MALSFHYASDPGAEAAKYLTAAIKDKLGAGQSLLWLLSGGSNVAVEVAVADSLDGVDLSRLTVMLMDERFGPVAHEDSNWQKLADAGFYLEGAIMLPVLIEQTFDSTISSFEETLQRLFKECDYTLGLFGMGADGHTAGLLPQIEVSNPEALVVGYKAADFERITMTQVAVSQLDEAVLAASGEAKWQQLQRLKTAASELEQPVQMLKRVPKVTIFSDFQEG